MLSKAQQWIWERASIRNHGNDYGKTPQHFEYKPNTIGAIGIEATIGKFTLKVFYTTKKCFYLDISINELDNWIKVMKEFNAQSPFATKAIDESLF